MDTTVELLVNVLKASWKYAPAKIHKRWSGLALFVYCLCSGVVYFVVWLALARWLAGSHTDICTGGVVALVVVVLLSGAVNYLFGNALDAADQPDEERPWHPAVAESSQRDTSLSDGEEDSGAPHAQESPRAMPTVDVQAETSDTVPEVAPAPADEGGVPAECAACGTWNPPGSVYCGECGAALEGGA